MREVLRRRMVMGLGNMAREDKGKELYLSSPAKKYRQSLKILYVVKHKFTNTLSYSVRGKQKVISFIGS